MGQACLDAIPSACLSIGLATITPSEPRDIKILGINLKERHIAPHQNIENYILKRWNR
jgi:hypothetical protein